MCSFLRPILLQRRIILAYIDIQYGIIYQCLNILIINNNRGESNLCKACLKIALQQLNMGLTEQET